MMRDNGRVVLAGLLVGMILAAFASGLLRGVLYGLGALDAISFMGPALLFLVLALAATWLPSRRAMRVDPMTALRHQ
jgi:putative ABC transport system permease protein